jgi:type IV secretory pathway TrbD component
VFNLFESLLAGIVVFIGGFIFGRWVTNADPAMLRILAQSERFKTRYETAKLEIPLVEVR